MKTINVNGTTINLLRDSEAKEVYENAAADFEINQGSRPSNRTAAKTWDVGLNTFIVQALTDLLDQRAIDAEDEISEVAPSNDKETEYEMTDPVPAYPSTATHTVVTEGRGLALRADYSVMRASDYAHRDKGRKGELLEMLEDDTEVIVLEEGVGYKCGWAQVTVPDLEHVEPAYVMYKFLEPLSSTASSLEMVPSKKSTPANDAWYINWDTKKVNNVYFDRRTAKWCIPVETEHTTTGGSELRNRMQAALYTGTQAILEYLDKKHTTEYVEELLSSFSFARAEEWYLEPRPYSHLRVLVTIPERYMGALESAPARGSVTMGYSPDKEYSKSGSAFSVDKVVYYNAFTSDTFRSVLKDGAKKLQQYQKDINKSGFKLEPCVNLTEEGDNLRAVLGKFKEHMLKNDHRWREEREDLVELGWDENFNLVWMMYTEVPGPRMTPTRGWSQLLDSHPFDNLTTMSLLFYVEHIVQTDYAQETWMEFVGKYLKPSIPKLKIYPSDSKADSRCADEVDVGDMFATSMNTKDGKKTAKVKLAEENDLLNNLDLKAAIVGSLKDKKDYIGDPVLLDLHMALANIWDIDDAFRFILSRLPITDLLIRLLACQQISFPPIEIDLSAIGDMMDNLSDLAGGVDELFNQVDALWTPELPKNFKIPKLSLPDKMPIADIMAGFKEMLKEMVKEMITMLFVEMVRGLLEGLVADCKDLDNNTTDDFGGENIGDMLADNSSPPQALEDLFNAMGLTPEEADEKTPNPSEDSPAKQIGGFLDDVSALLTPGELCALLNGNPPAYVIDLVRSLIVNYRQEFSKLDSTTKVIAAFRAIGGLADSSLCDKLAEASTGAPKLYLPTDRPLCDVDGSLRRLREDLLKDKGEDITDDQVEEMLDKVKDRKKKQAKQIQDLLENLENEDEPYIPPPVFCQKNPDGTITPGMMDELPESVTWMMKKAIDTMFEPTYMAFNLDAQEWAKPMIENTPVTQQVSTLVQAELEDEDGDKENHWVAHPEVKRQMALGMPEVSFFKKKADPFDLKHSDALRPLTPITVQKKRVAPHLQDSLEGLESNSAFDMLYSESGSYYYELVLPPDPNAVSAMQSLQENFADMDFGDLKIDTSMFSQFEGALPAWTVEYHMPVAKSSPPIVEEETPEVVEEGVLDLTLATIEDDIASEETEDTGDTELLIAPAAIDVDVDTIIEDAVIDPAAYLDDEYIISVKMNGMPIISVQNSVEMEPKKKAIIQSQIESDFSTVEFSPQQEVFGEYVKSMWQNQVGSSEVLNTHYDTMATYFKETIFSQISRDLFSHLTREVATSPFFDVIEGTVGQGDNKLYSWSPKIEMVVLNPDPTDAQRACNVDPHLLDLNCVKKKVLDDALAGMCDDPPPATDGKGSDEMNSIERAAMDACIRTTIRTNLIDYFLRGVFAFSTFDIETVLDNAALDMFGQLMEQDIVAFSNLYSLRFKEQADLTYANMVAEGYFVEEEAQRQAGIAAGTINEFNSPTGWSLPYLIKEQIVDVTKDLQDLLGTSGNVKSVKDKWLSTYVPVFDAPSSSYDVRFSELNDDVVTAENYSLGNVPVGDEDSEDYEKAGWSGYESGDTATDTETLITSKDGISFDLENGNFILERYIKVVDRNGLKQEWLDTARRHGLMTGNAKEFTNTTGVVNPEDLSKFIKKILDTDFDAATSGEESVRPEATLGELFNELKYGYRLTYIPPMASSQMVEVPYVYADAEAERLDELTPSLDYSNVLSTQEFPTTTTSLGEGTYNFGKLVSQFGEEHWQAAHETGAFAQYEVFEADKVTFNFDSGVLGNTLEATEIVRLVTPIPLVTVEEDIDLTMLLGDVGDGTYFEDNHPTTELHAALQEDDWFNIMFDYMFPLNRYMSVVTLYTITATSNYDGVPLSFENTRDELHRLFWILLNGGDYTYEDDNLNCIGGSGGLGNSSGKLASRLAKCFGLNFGFGMCLKGLGLGFVFKMMLMTPVLIFKLVVEFMDPNIAIAVKLFSLGCLLGIAIPIPIISFGMLPMNIFLGMPGPPITPLGLIYLALGLGNLDLSLGAGGDELDLGFKLPNKASEKGMSEEGCLPECEESG